MAAFVLDASVALAWLPGNEAESPQADQIVERAIATGAAAPPVWEPEVLNGLLVALRRVRFQPARVERILGDFDRLRLATQTSERTDPGATRSCFALAQWRAITGYDAPYFDLAIRHTLPTATFDGSLRHAAEAERVALSD